MRPCLKLIYEKFQHKIVFYTYKGCHKILKKKLPSVTYRHPYICIFKIVSTAFYTFPWLPALLHLYSRNLLRETQFRDKNDNVGDHGTPYLGFKRKIWKFIKKYTNNHRKKQPCCITDDDLALSNIFTIVHVREIL